MVAIRVTNVVLHMADNDVLPIGHIQSPVFTDDCVSWPKIAIIAINDVFYRSSPDLTE